MFRTGVFKPSFICRAMKRQYELFEMDVAKMGGLTVKQRYQMALYCQSLLATCRHKTPIELHTDEYYKDAILPRVSEDFPILNVSALRTPQDIYEKHFGDACSLVHSIDALRIKEPVIVDVGSGGGIPGLVLAIARPHWKIITVDSSAKKCRFMRAVIDRLELHNATTFAGNASVLLQPNSMHVPLEPSEFKNPDAFEYGLKKYIKYNTEEANLPCIEDKYVYSTEPKFEHKPTKLRRNADVVVSRGVTTLDKLIPLTIPFLHSTGTAIYQKGAQLATVLTEDQRQHQHPDKDTVFHEERRLAIRHAQNPLFIGSARTIMGLDTPPEGIESQLFDIISHEIGPARELFAKANMTPPRFVNCVREKQDPNGPLPDQFRILVMSQRQKTNDTPKKAKNNYKFQ